VLGRDLARGRKVNIGEAVASSPRSRSASPVRSSPCAPSTSAARRRGGGSFDHRNRHAGVVHFHGLKTVKRKDGALIA